MVILQINMGNWPVSTTDSAATSATVKWTAWKKYWSYMLGNVCYLAIIKSWCSTTTVMESTTVIVEAIQDEDNVKVVMLLKFLTEEEKKEVKNLLK